MLHASMLCYHSFIRLRGILTGTIDLIIALDDVLRPQCFLQILTHPIIFFQIFYILTDRPSYQHFIRRVTTQVAINVIPLNSIIGVRAMKSSLGLKTWFSTCTINDTWTTMNVLHVRWLCVCKFIVWLKY